MMNKIPRKWRLNLTECRRPTQSATFYSTTAQRPTDAGPTAVVFLNMGGPSTTDEVGPFLSRLFVIETFYIGFSLVLTET